jgi:spermidine synthase
MRRVFPIVGALFFLSGATALVAEVALNKILTYVFGASHLSTSTVLAAYMAGLSGGAWYFGRLASKRAEAGKATSDQAMRMYAVLELLVGVFYAALPSIFPWFQKLGIGLAAPLAQSLVLLTSVRFALCFVLVLLPTLLMGGTLPTLISAFVKGDSLQKSLPKLYALNTLGAAFGVLVGSYALLAKLGLSGGLYVCAAINFGIAGLAWFLSTRMQETESANASDVSRVEAESDKEASSGKHLQFAPKVALAFAFLQGALSFSLEVVWFHLIGTVIGVTTYAFALMLFSILLGIGLGSYWLPFFRRRTRLGDAHLFGVSMLFAATSVAVSLRGWDRFSRVVELTHGLSLPGYFHLRELVRLLFCIGMLLPTAIALGVSLPALAACVAPGEKDEQRTAADWVGRVFAANTVGTIVGSVFTGFVLLGRLGSERILQLALVGFLIAAGYPFLKQKLVGAFRVVVPAALLVACAFGGTFTGWDPDRLTLGMHYYWTDPNWGKPTKVEWIREDAQSGFITVSKSDDMHVLKTNGKYEGTDEAAEFQDLFALLGGLYLHRYERGVIVGLGPARTFAVMHAMPFKKLEGVEYSPAMIAAAKERLPFLPGPAADTSRVSIHCDDGRNHLQLAQGTYDYVAIAISGAAFAGAGNIYSRDFFETVKGKLDDDGVFMLWIQVHHVFPHDVRSVASTLRGVFPSVHFYADPSQTQGFLFASKKELRIDPKRVKALESSNKIPQILGQHGFTSVLDLVQLARLTTTQDWSRYMDSSAIGPPPRTFTDLYPAFEYSTPYALASNQNSFDFDQFSERALPEFTTPIDEDERLYLLARREYAAGRPAESKRLAEAAFGKKPEVKYLLWANGIP